MFIKIESTKITNRSGKNQETGRAWSINEQNALLFRDGETYPDKIKVNLEDGKSAYPVGEYVLHDESFSVNRYGNIQLRPSLISRSSTKPLGAVSNG